MTLSIDDTVTSNYRIICKKLIRNDAEEMVSS
jgi:hypothetical protein